MVAGTRRGSLDSGNWNSTSTSLPTGNCSPAKTSMPPSLRSLPQPSTRKVRLWLCRTRRTGTSTFCRGQRRLGLNSVVLCRALRIMPSNRILEALESYFRRIPTQTTDDQRDWPMRLWSGVGSRQKPGNRGSRGQQPGLRETDLELHARCFGAKAPQHDAFQEAFAGESLASACPDLAEHRQTLRGAANS